MGKEKGYIVLKIGFEYNDEFYSTGNYEKVYEAPSKVFSDKEKALIELKKQTFEELRGEDLTRYNGNGVDGICKSGMSGKFESLMVDFFEMSTDDCEMEIPKTATDEQLEQIIECLDLKFYELVEVELE